jgi:type IV secretory pathway VirB6-like protein
LSSGDPSLHLYPGATFLFVVVALLPTVVVVVVVVVILVVVVVGLLPLLVSL